MFNHIMSILSNGGLWTIIAIICGSLPKINKVIEAHLKTKKATTRNAHELSLMRAADRIIPSVMKVAEASKTDRLNEALSELTQYANDRGIDVNEDLVKHLIGNSLTKYTNNGGKIPDTIKSVTVQGDSLKEADPND